MPDTRLDPVFPDEWLHDRRGHGTMLTYEQRMRDQDARTRLGRRPVGELLEGDNVTEPGAVPYWGSQPRQTPNYAWPKTFLDRLDPFLVIKMLTAPKTNRI